MDGEVFGMDGRIIVRGFRHKLTGTLSLDVNSQRVYSIRIVKALYSTAVSFVDGKFCAVAQNQVNAAIVAKLAVYHDIAAL